MTLHDSIRISKEYIKLRSFSNPMRDIHLNADISEDKFNLDWSGEMKTKNIIQTDWK